MLCFFSWTNFFKGNNQTTQLKITTFLPIISIKTASMITKPVHQEIFNSEYSDCSQIQVLSFYLSFIISILLGIIFAYISYYIIKLTIKLNLKQYKKSF
mgnify:CR=1 FL=1